MAEPADAFTHAHSGGPGKVAQHDQHHHLGWKHLFKPPVIRQWLYQGRIFRGKSERRSTYVELFFDLTFVGVIHQLAEYAVDPEPSAVNIGKFILVFYPAWSVWSNIRDYINQSGTDDILQRLYVLLNMILLIGYSANATRIEIPSEEGHHHISSETYPQIHAATTFFLIAKLARALLYVVYIISLPKFKVGLASQLIQLLIPAFIWLPLAFLPEPEEEGGKDSIVLGLAIAGVVADLGLRWLFTFIVGKMSEWRSLHEAHLPALSIEHMMERISAFVVIVLGENILNAVYPAMGTEVGAGEEYGRAAFSVIIAFEILWLYFDADSSRSFIHALRRHYATCILFIQLHWPLCGALILSSSAQKEMVLHDHVEQGYRWYFSGGLAVTVFTTALIGWTHNSLDKKKSAYLPRSVRLVLRVLVSIMFALLPLAPNHSSTLIMGYHTAILAVLIMIETVGKLGSQAVDEPGNPRSDSDASGERTSREKRTLHDLEKMDLTETEMGEEDAGVEAGLKEMRIREVSKKQKLAHVS